MSIPIPTTTEPIDPPPVHRNAGEVWDEIGRMMGFDPATLPAAASLPPWTEEEAAAFERAINEACEQIEEPQHPLP